MNPYAAPGINPDIKQAICSELSVSLADVGRKNRHQPECTARQLIFVFTRYKFPWIPLKGIGKINGEAWDHSTVLHSIKIFCDLWEASKEYRELVSRIGEKVGIDPENIYLKFCRSNKND